MTKIVVVDYEALEYFPPRYEEQLDNLPKGQRANTFTLNVDALPFTAIGAEDMAIAIIDGLVDEGFVSLRVPVAAAERLVSDYIVGFIKGTEDV